MCCSCSVQPVDRETAEAILALGMFNPAEGLNPGDPTTWEREVREEDGTVLTIKASVAGDNLRLDIFPRISTPSQHRRISGSVYFEIACKVAEKYGSRIVQASNVGDCIENSDRLKLLADYGAGQPMDWAAVCVGFQRVIVGE